MRVTPGFSAAHSAVNVDLPSPPMPDRTVTIPSGTRPGMSHSIGSRLICDAGRAMTSRARLDPSGSKEDSYPLIAASPSA